MAGEIQIGGTTFATESAGTVTVSNVDSATNRQNLGLEIGVNVQSYDADTTKNDVANTFTANQIISVTDNTNAALRVTQLGTGNALVVEDSANPDSTPFVVDATGTLISGASSSYVFAGSSVAPRIQVQSLGGGDSSINATSWASGVNVQATFILARSEGGSVGSHTVVDSNDNLGRISFQGSDGTAFIEAAKIESFSDGTPGTNDMPGRLVFSTTADGASSPTERMQIDSSGKIGIGSSTVSSVGIVTQSGEAYLMVMRNSSGADQVQIESDGDIRNVNNSYGAISDIKLKENITDANNQWNDIKNLRVVNFNFTEASGYSQHRQIGFVAQEVELVCPGLVSESIDRDEAGNELGTVTKSVRSSIIFIKAVKALQEAMDIIESQQSQIDALTSRIEALETT